MKVRLELVTVPVSDVDRAKAFYVDQVGFSSQRDVQVDDEHRFVELMPPGSPCSIALTTGYIDSEPGSLQGIQVNVDDVEEVHAFLRNRGVDVQRFRSTPGAASASSPIPTATAGRSTKRQPRSDRGIESHARRLPVHLRPTAGNPASGRAGSWDVRCALTTLRAPRTTVSRQH